MSSNLRIKRICAWCGKEFIAQKTTTACCFKQCANALYKKRKRDEAIKANNQIVEKKIEEKPIERIKDKPFLTITETAIYLGVTRPTVYGYIKRSELKVIRLGFKYLLNKDDIDVLFNNPTEFHTPTKEKAPITDFYTTAEVKEKYHVNESWIFLVAKKNNIPRTFNRGKITMIPFLFRKSLQSKIQTKLRLMSLSLLLPLKKQSLNLQNMKLCEPILSQKRIVLFKPNWKRSLAIRSKQWSPI